MKWIEWKDNDFNEAFSIIIHQIEKYRESIRWYILWKKLDYFKDKSEEDITEVVSRNIWATKNEYEEMSKRAEEINILYEECEWNFEKMADNLILKYANHKLHDLLAWYYESENSKKINDYREYSRKIYMQSFLASWNLPKCPFRKDIRKDLISAFKYIYD